MKYVAFGWQLRAFQFIPQPWLILYSYWSEGGDSFSLTAALTMSFLLFL